MNPALPCEISGLPEKSPSLIEREALLLTMSVQGEHMGTGGTFFPPAAAKWGGFVLNASVLLFLHHRRLLCHLGQLRSY